MKILINTKIFLQLTPKYFRNKDRTYHIYHENIKMNHGNENYPKKDKSKGMMDLLQNK